MLREAVEAQERVRFDRSHFMSYGDSSLVFETVYFVLTADYLTFANTNQSVNLAVLRRFSAERIDFAFPTRTIVIRGGAPGVVPAPA